MPPRVESDSTPPPRALNLTKPNVALPMAMLGGLIGIGYIVGQYAEKIPTPEHVEKTAKAASRDEVREALRTYVQPHFEKQIAVNEQQAATNARVAVTLARLEVYTEIHAMGSLRPTVTSPKAQLMRKNIIEGRDPLAGIVPSETRD